MRHGFESWPAIGVATTALLCVLIAACPVDASQLLDPDSPTHAKALRGLEALHAGDHALANRLLMQFINEEPSDPLGPLLRMKLSWWGILEGRDPTGALYRRLKGDLTRVRALAEMRLDHDRNDVRALFALGEAYCTLGRLQGIRGAGWSTLRNHRKGAPLLERAIELEPGLVEALASLGVFHYYASQAPGFLRFLARFFSVQGDREGGLQQLRRAATAPGAQQEEAAFFLLEILTNVEDEHLEALPFALRMHQRYPRNLGFRVSLASVQIGLGRPDLSVELLSEALDDEDPTRAVAARFFLARALVMSRRSQEAIELLAGFSAGDFDQVAWLRAWHSYYLGVAHEQLGRRDEAHQAYERTRAIPMVADSHGYAQRALSRRPGDLQDVLRQAEASIAWSTEPEEIRRQLAQALESDFSADDEELQRARYAYAVLSLRCSEFGMAVESLRSLVEDDDSDEAWLVVRPRIRLLQALLRGGHRDAARAMASKWQPELENWGSNRHLELLVANCLQTDDPTLPLADDRSPQPGGGNELFRLKDTGFTDVTVRLEGREDVYPTSLRDDFWEAAIPLPPGTYLYHFEIEAAQPLPDPSNRRIREHAGLFWSVLEVQNES